MHKLSWILLLIGGLNWGLIGVGSLAGSDWNVVGLLGMTVANIIYVLVGLSAVYEIATHKKNCKCCDGKSGGAM